MAFVRVTDPEQIVQLYLAKVLYFTYPGMRPEDARPCFHGYSEIELRHALYDDDTFYWFYVHLED